MLCNHSGIECKPTTFKNQQANAILESLQDVVGNMLCTVGLESNIILDLTYTALFIIDAAWAVPFTHHTILGSSPEAAILGKDILFDLSYMAG